MDLVPSEYNVFNLKLAYLLCGAVVAYIAVRKSILSSPLDNIPGPPSRSFWTGNMTQLFNRQDGHNFFDYITHNYQRVVRLHGSMGARQLFIYDPLAVHHIIVKDQENFQVPTYFAENLRLFGGEGLLVTHGSHHKRQRKLLAPAFSSVAMRNMCTIFYGTGHKLRNAMQARVKEGAREVDMSTWMSRTALQLVGEAGLGYSFDDMVEDTTTNNYALCLKSIPTLFFSISIFRRLLPYVVNIGTPSFQRFVVDVVPWPTLHRLRDALDEQYKHTVDIIAQKKRAMKEGDMEVANQIGQGKDIISILLKENMEADEGERIPESEVLAQVSTLVLAATDTTSSALSRTLHLLALHPNVQTRLRGELREARAKQGGEDIPYDELVDLPYLDAICRETLRLHSPVPHRERTATRDMIVPLAHPIRGIDGKEMTAIEVPKGTTIYVAIAASNRDPSVWGNDAAEWKPERWLAPLPETVAKAHVPGIYSNLLTFFGGGRACIGFKFSQLEMKVILALLVEDFEFSLPKDKEIVWNFANITYPGVKGDGGAPGMPMVISKAL